MRPRWLLFNIDSTLRKRFSFVMVPNAETAPEDPLAAERTASSEHFRLFYVNSADRFQGYELYESDSDIAALERGRSILQHHPYAVAIEVWKRSIFVGRVDR